VPHRLNSQGGRDGLILQKGCLLQFMGLVVAPTKIAASLPFIDARTLCEAQSISVHGAASDCPSRIRRSMRCLPGGSGWAAKKDAGRPALSQQPHLGGAVTQMVVTYE
jgi:hypothetical protein